jgi:hypothetical protein
MEEQHEPKALDGLHRDGSSKHGVTGLLQEIVREGTGSGSRSWHGGILDVAGILLGGTPFYQESAETTTLFVKRTTKRPAMVKLHFDGPTHPTLPHEGGGLRNHPLPPSWQRFFGVN